MIVLVAVGALIGPSALGIVENPLNGVGAQLIFTVGVAMIIFHGGVGISLRVISRTAVGLGLLVLPGVAITAFIVAPIFGVSLLVALMIGAVLASTDPTIIIPLFERLGLRPKVSQTVIAESVFNDVTGTVLTLTLVSAVEAAHFSVSGPVFEFFKELALGAVNTARGNTFVLATSGPDDDIFLGLFIFAAIWALLSGAVVLLSIHEMAQRSAWRWATSLVVASLVMAYCFWKLI
jgi:potassium/hydrogen antiporter